MAEPGFAFDGYAAARLSAGDVAELQQLHERCSGYFLLIEGGPVRPTSAREDMEALPPGKEAADKFLFEFRPEDGRLVGALELVRDYPGPGQWYIGLLTLDPDARGAGLGTRIYQAARAWIRAQGGHEIALAVLQQNTQAERFWRRHGFVELTRVPYVAATGFASTAIVMTQQIDPA